MEIVSGPLAVLLGYLLGSVSFAHLVARRTSLRDVSELEDEGAGASTVYRIVGARAGTLVFLGDFSKSAVAVLLAQKFGSPFAAMLAGMAAVAGHNWPIFYGFKGGRGAAAAAGALLALVPVAIGLGLVLAGLAFAITRNMLITSAALFLMAVPLAWAMAYPLMTVAYAAILPSFVAAYTWLSRRHVPVGQRWRTTFMRR